MIINNEDKKIYDIEIPEASPIRSYDISNLDFDLDKGYIVKYYLTMARVSGEENWDEPVTYNLEENGAHHLISISSLNPR